MASISRLAFVIAEPLLEKSMSLLLSGTPESKMVTSSIIGPTCESSAWVLARAGGLTRAPTELGRACQWELLVFLSVHRGQRLCQCGLNDLP